ncbi:DUF4157 domain-containing protein [Deinococcus sp. 6GRE01]|uniref:eCIS core domain-containing protein n=1 Tax=Deinococcus sp. 6GRE01 TaxID=2745873 RepID=UPI001E364B19|nr:DUF4157 domain-containing protein [Deinococcus sp. 6GRE01]MCD0155803.1 DUF4157 domain-containing protein [Deinococcus sp. 6GRE01]
MTFVQRRQSRRVPAPRPVASSQVPLTAADEQQARLRQALHRHTTRPVTAQRQQAAPVLRAASLDRAEAARLEIQRQSVQAQLSALPAPAGQPTRPSARPVPARPVTPDEWVTILRHRAEGIEGQRLDTRAFGEFQALQRQVAQQLAQGFRADRGDAQARYATYGEQLATLQRHALSAPVARVVLGMVPPSERLPLQRAADEALQRFQAQEQAALNFESLQTLQRQLAELDAEATQPVLQRIQARRGGGNPLPEAVRRHLEHGLNHDLSRVRIHDDAEADKLAKGVNAIAFTTGTDIFFRSGRFDPNTRGGLELLAHEVTHTVQQSQGRVGTGIDPDAGLESEARVMGARLAQVMPSPRSLLPPVPHRDGPHAPGVYSPAAALTRVQAGAADHALLTPLRALQRQPDLTLQRSVIGDRLGDLARGIPGYTPLTMAMGFDPVAGKAVKADPNVLLDALARFVPGPFKDMVKVVRDQKLLPKAWAWFQGELGELRLGNVVTGIKAALSGLPNLVKARNLLVEATNSVRRLVLGSARKLADIALTAITAGLGPVGKKLMGNLRQSGDIVTQVLKNPGQFAANLMNALRQGFLGFVGRSGQWIRQGLGDWLSGSANIQFPRNLNVEGVLMTALSIMNLGYDALRARLIRELGPGAEGKVALLEKAGGALGQLRGNVGKAPELRAVATQLSGEVLGGIKADVTETLVKKGVQRVALMFSPAGAAVGAILTAWNTVQTVIDKGQQIMGVIMTALGSVREIAAGRVAGAARFIEQTIGKALPVVFSFAGRMLRIGNIGARLKKLVQGMRQKLGIDKLIDAVMARLKKVVGAGRQVAGRAIQGAKTWWSGLLGREGFSARTAKGSENHTLSVKPLNGQPSVFLASHELPILQQFGEIRKLAQRAGTAAQVEPTLARIEQFVPSAERKIRNAATKEESERQTQRLLIMIRQGLLRGQVYLHVSSQLDRKDLPRSVLYGQAQKGKRVGHHVPPYALAEVMKNQFASIATEIEKGSRGSPHKARLSKAAASLRKRVQDVHQLTGSKSAHGPKLMSIEISSEAHKACASKFGVHQSNLSVVVERELIRHALTGTASQPAVLLLKADGKLSATFSGQHWQGALEAVRHRQASAVAVTGRNIVVKASDSKAASARATTMEILKSYSLKLQDSQSTELDVIRSLQEGIDQMVETMRETTETALVTSGAQVREALRTSLKDGPHDQHDDVLGDNIRRARRNWQPIYQRIRL